MAKAAASVVLTTPGLGPVISAAETGLILLLIFANDFVAMSLATDHVSFSATPDRCSVPSMVRTSLGVAVPWLAFSFATFYAGRDILDLRTAQIQTLVFLMLVFTGQATIYLVREHRRLWSSARAGGCSAAPSPTSPS